MIYIQQTQVIRLDAGLQWLTVELAKKRMQQNNRDGAKATYYFDMEPMKVEVNYVGSEMAFCLMHNVMPDVNWTNRRPEDCIYQGYRYDIKWTHLEYGHLLAKVKDRPNPPDYFALMVGLFPEFEFAGRMAAFELLRGSRIKTKLGKTKLPWPAYAAQQRELKT
jgi:hypothetical protein